MRQYTTLIMCLTVLHMTSAACQMSPLDIFSTPDHGSQGQAAFEDGNYDLAVRNSQRR